MSQSADFPYLHGFSKDEQERLRKQARFGEHTVYQNINLSAVKELLEVGCGVGAQSEILLRRFPDIKLTGIDRSPKQLQAARARLSHLALAAHRFELKEMDATAMEFSSNSFDGAFLCWILEVRRHHPGDRRQGEGRAVQEARARGLRVREGGVSERHPRRDLLR